MRLLTAGQLEPLVDREATRAIVAETFAEIARGAASQPAPQSMWTSAEDGRYIVMSAASDATGTAAVKLLADVPGNAQRGLPTQRSLISVVARETGEPVALLHGGVPTRVRTAAASAVATDALARPDARVLGLLGAGALAREHVEMLRDVRDFETLVVWSRTGERARALADAVEWRGEIVVADGPREAVDRADVLCTLTPSVAPILRGAWLRPGQHLNVVGARPRPDEREVDAEAMARSRVWVDDRATAGTKSGDLLLAVGEGALSLEDVVGTLGEVIAGSAPGRRSADEITLFDSVGIGAQDLAIAHLLVERAAMAGVGSLVDLSA
ncbi:ornithine cyclodeaminase family protein [Microbacterium excoecariae]|uniref:ornithine cyclodeaminase family protein n=1 Tax=Microbacterium excoecariae TaxID=2715210 RepID=UPI00197C932D|nr:ornithine cyclodeaminase family protein [Microbacterium excoecariae]